MRASYIEETTTSIAGTGGNGAVTLTPITGMPRFSTVFGTAARMVEYAIEDTVNFYYEEGIGSVASNVLTRTQPRMTWNGTTYDSTAPSALAFGSSPTSGNIRVRMSPLASSFTPNPVFMETSFGLNLGLPCGDIIGGPSGGSGFNADQEIWFPYLWRGTREIDQFAIRHPTSHAGVSVKFALSEVRTDGRPGAKLIDFGAVSFNTSGVKTVSSSSFTPSGDTFLPPGYYFIGVIPNGGIDLNTVAEGAIRPSVLGVGSSERPLTILQQTSGGSYATGLTENPTGLTAPNYFRPVVYLRPKA